MDREGRTAGAPGGGPFGRRVVEFAIAVGNDGNRPYIPLGQNLLPVAFKKYVTGTLTGFPIFWNVKKDA